MAGHRIRQRRIGEGLCADCGEPRGNDGTATQCRTHAKDRNKRQARRNAKVRQYRRDNHLCTECGVKLVSRKASLCRAHLIENQIRQKNHRLRPVIV